MCIHDIISWMNSNKLMLNTDKTEMMLVGTPASLRLVDSNSAHIEDTIIPFQKCVKYLGVKIDQVLSMQDQVSSICRACFLELRRIASLRPFISSTICAQLVIALITSRLDYCNSILDGLPSEQISRLQRVQNNAARLVLKKRRREHVTPLLKQLHWLPIAFRTQYKLAIFAFRHFDGSLPPYLSSALTTYQPSRSLRSSSELLLKVPRTKLKSAGEKSFGYRAPIVWNSLPVSLRSCSSLARFKAGLKSHLFKLSFR